MLNSAVRLLAFAAFAFAFALWAGIDWISHPRAPVVHEPLPIAGTEHVLPYVALMGINGSAAANPWPSAFSISSFALTAITSLLAATLAAWLAWRSTRRPALRDLTLALTLGSVAVSWFWFTRPWAPPLVAGAQPVLDYVGVLAWCISGWALQNCFSVYPEPISRAWLDKADVFNEGRCARARRGDGIWRYWSWLPPERYGAYGRASATHLRGWRRFVRSRELLWLFSVAALTCILWRLFPYPDVATAWRAVACLGLAWAFVCALDPVFDFRVDPLLLFRRRAAGRFINAELTIREWCIGWRGLAVAALIGTAFTIGWQAGATRRTVASAALLLWGLVVVGNALNLLYVNWQSGNTEQRRAIAWIFLGTAGMLFVWMASVFLTSLAMLTTFKPFAAKQVSYLGQALDAEIALGPALIAFAFVLSLWCSILHRGSFDPALALRRGAGVAVLGIVLTALFVATEGAASSLIVTHLGMPTVSGPVIAGTVVALGFKPLRERVERGVERTMLRLLPPESVAAGERRVCAILFADLSGYTRLSETDEAEAMTLAAILHRQARAAASAHQGRVVKTIGDAVLCIFEEAPDALAATRELARGYRDEATRHALELLPLHSGLHVGEVTIARDGDVFGASVNLAARLQSLAGADELIATSSVSAAIVAAATPAEPLPARRFKNIAEPVDCLRLRLA